MYWLSDELIHDLPPEMPGGLTFHLPMELAALRIAGAPDSVIEAVTTASLGQAYAAGLVDPPLYRWAVERYRETAARLLSSESSEQLAALADIEPLAEGLAGAAFHGLIRLAYGLWRADVDEVTRGLAYLRTRRQVLVSGSRVGTVTGAADDLPPFDQRDGATVFDLLNLAAGSAACECTPVDATARALASRAGGLVRRNPSSFVAVHALTATHALCELQATVESAAGPEGLLAWWQTLAVAQRACSLLVDSGPPDAIAPYDDRFGPVGSSDELVAAAVRSSETHDVKMAVSLRRMVEFGYFTEDEVVEVGRARLSVHALGS